MIISRLACQSAVPLLISSHFIDDAVLIYSFGTDSPNLGLTSLADSERHSSFPESTSSLKARRVQLEKTADEVAGKRNRSLIKQEEDEEEEEEVEEEEPHLQSE